MARIDNWNPPELSFHTARYEWDVDYATKVHEGDISKSGNIYPARPWTDDALSRIDVEREFREAWIDNEDLDDTFRDFAQLMFNEFHVSMADEKWNWPTITQRKNGEAVGSPRSIIDTQELYNSQSLEFE
jgi:hypothetical protein